MIGGISQTWDSETLPIAGDDKGTKLVRSDTRVQGGFGTISQETDQDPGTISFRPELRKEMNESFRMAKPRVAKSTVDMRWFQTIRWTPLEGKLRCGTLFLHESHTSWNRRFREGVCYRAI
jgi:hypothetical protein